MQIDRVLFENNFSGALTNITLQNNSGSYNFTINFPCGPENAEALTQSALRELNKIIENGPEDKDVNKFKEAEKLDYKEKIKQNNYWMSYLTRSFTYGVSADEILQVEQKIDAVTAKDIQAVAKKYLSKDKVVAMLMPEE